VDIGAPELVIVLVILLVLFGGKKIPEVARSLGRAQHEFRAGLRDGTDGEEPVPPAPSGAPAAPQSDEPGAGPQ